MSWPGSFFHHLTLTISSQAPTDHNIIPHLQLLKHKMMQLITMSDHFYFHRNETDKSLPYETNEEQEQKLQPSQEASLKPAALPQADLNKSDQDVQTRDVLCGRDKKSHSHVGNKRFRQIVLMHREEYQTASSRDIKTKITCKIVKMIRDCGGRFLKEDETTGEWKDVGDNYAREKVSHALRSAKDPNRPKVKKQREAKKYIPSPEDEALFQATLADQQRIFQGLMDKGEKGEATDLSFDNIDSLLAGI